MVGEQTVLRAKICGIRTSEAAIAAAEGGADYLGFILAPSKRQVRIDDVAAIRGSLEEWQARGVARRQPLLTAVVVNLNLPELAAIAGSGAVDVIQLSGDETPEVLDELPVPIVKAVRVDPERGEVEARRTIESWLDRSRPAAGILLDAWHPSAFGGTGETADWAVAARLAADYPIWLAGGLTPANVGEAIAAVRPFGVDVSSGVEKDGVKDPALIRAFLERVRAPQVSL